MTSEVSARLSLTFSCIGHACSHLFAPIFYVAALSLEKDLAMTHGAVITLILVGSVLFGLAAPLAGWLSDKWSAIALMVVFFIGSGGAMVMVGFASTPFWIAFWLAITGLFGAIYHPVGISWLVRNAANRGTALGINGMFGAFGPGIAAVAAGVLIEAFDWRIAFIVPGIVVMGFGVLFLFLVQKRLIVERATDRNHTEPQSRRDTVRAFMVMGVTMVCTGLIYQATQASLPKIFSERVSEVVDGGTLGLSVLVAGVYLCAGVLQILAGYLADRYSLKAVYLWCYVLQTPFLILAASLSGTALVVVAMIMVSINVGSLPAENSLVAKYAPAQWRGLAFGLKFILAFGVSGLGVYLEGGLYDLTGDFAWLYTVLALIAVVGLTSGLLLPPDRLKEASVAAE
jgi:MFS transporter, FSR family, fosmidomycin resistance protein